MKNLTTKMVRVMKEIKGVGKNGQNDFHKYSYIKETDVSEVVRDELIKENIFIYTSVEGTSKEGDITSIVLKHVIVDADSGESVEIRSFGQGSDKTGDKGGPKAYTSALKYMMLKLFLIGSNDDPEASDSTGKSTAPTPIKAAPAGGFVASARKAAKPPVVAIAENLPQPRVEESNGF